MPRRRKWDADDASDYYRACERRDTFTHTTAKRSREVPAGSEISFLGVRGRFNFVEAVHHPDGRVELSVYGGSRNPQGVRQWRTFPAGRVKAVHWKRQLVARKDRRVA